MIFAPRSWPSRPGFAITTRIFPATIRKYMSVKLTVVGCSPAWPNPGGAQSGYLVEGPGRLLLDCGPGVLARLREQDAVAPGRRDRDHALAPRPLGRPRAVGLGREVRPGPRSAARPQLWVPPERPRARHGRRAARPDGDVRPGVRRARVRGGEPFEAAGFEVVPHRVSTTTLLAFGFRVRERHDARLLGRLGPGERSPSSRATPTSSSARRRCRRRPEGEPARPPRRRGGGRRLRGRRARGGSWSRTGRSSGRSTDELEQAYDGQKLEIAPGG